MVTPIMDNMGAPADVLDFHDILFRRIEMVLQSFAVDDAMLFEFVDQWIDNNAACVLLRIPTVKLCEYACAKLQYAVQHMLPLRCFQQCARIVTIGVLKDPAVVSTTLIQALVAVIQAGAAIYQTEQDRDGEGTSRTTIVATEIAASHLDHLPKLLLRSPYTHEVLVVTLSLLTMSMCCNNVTTTKLVAAECPQIVSSILALLRVSLTSQTTEALVASRLCLTCLQSLILGAPHMFRGKPMCLQVAILLGQSAEMSLQRMRAEGIGAVHILEVMNATADVIAAFSLLQEGAILALHPMKDAVSGAPMDHFTQLRHLDAMDAAMPTLFDMLMAYVDELTSAARSPTTERALADVISAVRSLCDHPRAREMVRSRGYIPTIMKIVANGAPSHSERAQGHALALVLLAMQDDATRREFITAGLLVPIVTTGCTNSSDEVERKTASLPTSLVSLTEPLKVPPLLFNVQLYALSILVLLLEAEDHATLMNEVVLFHYELLLMNTLHSCTNLEIMTLLLRCVAAMALHPDHEFVCSALLNAGYVAELLLCTSRLIVLTPASTDAVLTCADHASNAIGLPAAVVRARVVLAASTPSAALQGGSFEGLCYCMQALTSICAVKQASKWYTNFFEFGGADVLRYLLHYPSDVKGHVLAYGPSLQSLASACALNILAEHPPALHLLQAAMGGRVSISMQCQNLTLQSDVLTVYHRLLVASEASDAAQALGGSTLAV
jgi:hypothetical protein